MVGSYYQPPVDTAFRSVTGGVGLESINQISRVLVESDPGTTRTLEAQGALSESESFSISAGELNQHVIPSNTPVTLTFSGVDPFSGGLVATELDVIALNGSTFAVAPDPLSSEIAYANFLYGQAAQNAVAAQAAYDAQLQADLAAALDAGILRWEGEAGNSPIVPNTDVFSESFVDPGFGGGGVDSEQPQIPPPSSQSVEDTSQSDAWAAQAAAAAAIAAALAIQDAQNFNGFTL